MLKKIGKRGSERDLTDKLLYVAWELIVLGIIAVIILMTIRSVAINSTFWKKYYSTDLALIIDIENTNRGDFIIDYNVKNIQDNFYASILGTRIFEIMLKADKDNKNYIVSVYDVPKEDDKYGIFFPYAKNRLLEVRESSIIADFLVVNKVGEEIYLDTYYIDSSNTCPSLNTKKDISNLKFRALSLNDKTNNIANRLSNVLEGLSRNSSAKKELSILLSYDNTLSIMYSNDYNMLRSQKMACYVAKKLSPKKNPKDIQISKYDDSFTNNKMEQYLKDKDENEYWIIIKLSDTELNMDFDLFANKIIEAIEEYYR